MSQKIKIKLAPGAQCPYIATKDSAGADLYANIPAPITLRPFERKLIPTGIFIQLPKGYEAQIRPTSGNALKLGITVLNSPGTIDADYTGEIGVILYNASSVTHIVLNGNKIAQMVIAKYERLPYDYTDEFRETERGNGGFGSTEKKK